MGGKSNKFHRRVKTDLLFSCVLNPAAMETMLNKISVLILFVTIVFSQATVFGENHLNKSAIELSNNNKKNTYLKVLDSTYKYSLNGLTVVCNGIFGTTGDCSPQIQVGLIKKNNIGLWDTIVEIDELGILMCGVGNYEAHNDTILISLPHWYYPEIHDVSDFSGVYKLTFFEYKRGKRIKQSSNAFVIEPFIIKFNSNQQPTGFLDTTFVKSTELYDLNFMHMRVFPSITGNAYNVWHRLHIEQTNNSGNDYLFDKVFSYTLFPFSEGNDIFEAKDFNLDGFVDFRIKSEGTGFDYYLFDRKQDEFIFSKIFSHAYSISIDTETNILYTKYVFEIPLEETYIREATFSLPDLHLLSLVRVYSTQHGEEREDIDSTHLHFPIKLTWPDKPQSEIDVVYGNSPKIITNKKHYFQNDSVFLISNGLGNLSDISKLNFVIEAVYPFSTKWQLTPSNPYLEEKKMLNNNNGFTIKAGDVQYVSNLEFAWNGLLVVGTYRIMAILDEKIVARTPDFYVYDEMIDAKR